VISTGPNVDEPYDPDFYRNSLWFDIWSPDGSGVFCLDREELMAAAQARWGDAVTMYVAPVVWSLSVDVRQPGGQDFEIYLAWDRQSVSLAMLTEDDLAEPAAWIRSLLPEDPGGRIWIIRGDLACHADLPAGITADQIRKSWIYHENPTTDIWQLKPRKDLGMNARISGESHAENP
jgi:hypothetical protein